MSDARPAAEPIDGARIDVPLVRALLADQFPEWAHLPLRPRR